MVLTNLISTVSAQNILVEHEQKIRPKNTPTSFTIMSNKLGVLHGGWAAWAPEIMIKPEEVFDFLLLQTLFMPCALLLFLLTYVHA